MTRVKVIVFLLSILLFQFSTAQLALIKDPDGFCNVRAKPGNQSKIEDTLSDGRIVYAFDEQEDPNWLIVDYAKGNNIHDIHSGYVHKSRIVFLEKMPTYKVVKLTDSLLTLQLGDATITMKKGKFISKGRKIHYDKPGEGSPFLDLIDGKRPWGTDGNMPQVEYRSIQLKSANNVFAFPRSFFDDLFQPNFESTAAHIDKATNRLYIEAMNSDGAGGYLVVWVLQDQHIINREVFIPF